MKVTLAEPVKRPMPLTVSLYVPMALAFLLYRQIIYRRGVPFPMNLPAEPRTLDAMTDAELDAKLQHSYGQSLAGEGRPFEAVFDELEKGLT